MRWMGTGLAESGLLRAYVTPVAATPALRRRVERLPGSLSRRFGRELALRDLPRDVDPGLVATVATVPELLQVAVQRSPLPSRFTWGALHLRSVAFDRGVSRLLTRGDLGVISSSNAAIGTIRAASRHGVRSFLDYPVAHHAWAKRLLSEEARLHPELADTLQLAELPSWMQRRMDSEIEEADRIFVLTGFQRQTFIESGVDRSKLILTPLGVELDLFQPARESQARDTFRVLFAGQLSQRKGLSYVLEGFRRASLPDAELLLLGSPVGSARPWADLRGVRQRGPIAFGDLPLEYQRSDVFVLPSLAEGFPQTLIQAMASGLPAIVTEHTADPETVADGVNGFVIPIRDPDAIAERLRYLYENPGKREEMGAASRRRAEQFTWDAYGRRVAEAVAEA
jgi:glycosyltransferase involved in cell wall biosynthesis